MLRRFDGIAEDGRQFLVNLQHEIRRNLSIQEWIETVWAQFTDQASEWINNEKDMMIILDKESPSEADKERFIQRICEKYPVAKKSVAKLIDMQQGQGETVKEYYQRIHDALVETGRKDILLSVVIRNWINGLNNRKLSAHLASRPINQSSLYEVCIIAERKLRQKEGRRLQKKEERKLQKEYQLTLQQQLQDIVDRDVARTRKSYESLPILEEMPCDLPEISTAIVDTDTESTDEVLASGPGKWIAADAGKEVFDSTSTPAGPSKNQPASHVKKHIEAVVVDTDTESTDEVLASGPGKWIAAAAGKEVFGDTSTSDEASKNPTEASDNSFG